MIRITFRRAFDRHGNRLRGRFVAMLGDQQLCVSSNPFQAAARVLINAGYDPALPIAGRPAEANFDTLTSTIAPCRRSSRRGGVAAFLNRPFCRFAVGIPFAFAIMRQN